MGLSQYFLPGLLLDLTTSGVSSLSRSITSISLPLLILVLVLKSRDLLELLIERSKPTGWLDSLLPSFAPSDAPPRFRSQILNEAGNS